MQAANATTADFARHLDASAPRSFGTPLLHKVAAGDTLSQIILDNYGAVPGSSRYRLAEAQLLYFNREVVNPSRIRVGQILRLLPLAELGSCPMPGDFSANQVAELPTSKVRHYLEPADAGYAHRIGSHIPIDPAGRDAFRALVLLEHNYSWLAQPAGVGLATFGLITGPGNVALIQEVGRIYDQYQRGHLTKGQYDYRRQQILKRFAQNLGPFERLVLGGQRANKTVRISRTAGIPATSLIDASAARLGRLSKYATRGGLVLAGAGLYVGCRQIAASGTRHMKNEIMVETLASTSGGLLAGLAISVLLVSNPVGWAAALVIATGSAAGSMAFGTGAKHIYNRWGERVDLVAMTGTDMLCN